MYERFQDRASVVFAYVAEAHSSDGWQMSANLEEDVLVAQHTTFGERCAAARAGADRLGLTMPVLVDDMDNAVSEAFAAWPERIYVVLRDGTVAFAGGPGPWDFDPDAATVALEEVLAVD
jgi:Iodothyronine deiodinase